MKGKREKKSQKKNNKFIRNLIITVIFLICTAFIVNIAPNYIKESYGDKTALVINYNNITKRLKRDIIIENENIYISTVDIMNFFDETIYYDKDNKQIVTTSDKKIAVFPIDSNTITVNGSKKKAYACAIQKEVDGEEVRYLPISELKDIYNIQITYIKDSNTVTIESLDRECKVANTVKNNNVKYLPTQLSKTVDKIEKGESVTVISTTNDDDNGYQKVITDLGIIGYVKKNTLSGETVVRNKVENEKQIEGKVSLGWEYFSEYGKAPDMTGKELQGVNVVSPAFFELKKLGKGEINENVGDQGIAYINWAKENNYKVWAMFSNSSLQDTTHEILNDYKLRQNLIENVVKLVSKYNLDGINIDFENMLEEDKDMYSRFIVELAPRLREYGKVLTVDVTAPDGSANWSLCYDRHVLGHAADYLIFMAYDQYGVSSKTPGTTAGYNWVESSLKKFVDENREGVDSDKIILAVPFYTRLWTTENGTTKSGVISIKYTNEVVPQDVQKTWDDDLRQYYSKYEQDGKTCEIWFEEERSLKEKLSLISEYNLAGAAYWRLGMENDEIWDVISEYIQ